MFNLWKCFCWLQCRLVVLALEVGGRWSSEAAPFVRLFARCRARAVPRPLRPAIRARRTPTYSVQQQCPLAAQRPRNSIAKRCVKKDGNLSSRSRPRSLPPVAHPPALRNAAAPAWARRCMADSVVGRCSAPSAASRAWPAVSCGVSSLGGRSGARACVD